MLKLLVTGLIVYAAYKFFFNQNTIGKGQETPNDQIRNDARQQPPQKESHEDDYIDYEEVD